MNKLFLSIIFIVIVFSAGAQNTWIQRLNFSPSTSWYNSDSLVGIKDISISQDGSIYALANLGKNNVQSVYKLPINGHPILWSDNIDSHGGLGGGYARSIFATSDLGVVVSHTHENWVGWQTSYGYIEKYGQGGSLQWSIFFDQSPNYPNEIWDRIVYDVIQSNTGNYYALVGDSLFKADPNGNIISSTNLISGQKLREMQNGDLLVLNGSSLRRVDTTGNVIWSRSCTGKFSFSANNVFILNGASINKVDASSGSIIWARTYPYIPISDIEATAQGGFIASIGYVPGDLTSWGGIPSPGHLICADSTGDTLWTRTYDFPYDGLSALAVNNNGSIVTGGAYLTGSLYPDYVSRDFNSFCTLLDSNGNGVLQQTTYMWQGDANNNRVLSFIDDGLYMVIANGDTGYVRDTIPGWGESQFYGTTSDYAIDWPDTFVNGVNKKCADFNGNGIIDTNDVLLFPPLENYISDSILIWDPFRISNSENSASIIPDFNLIAIEDTVAPGDSIHFLIIAGSAMIPIDSLCGLAFSFYPTSNNIRLGTTSFYDCDLGTRGINLFTTNFNYSALTCRTNHQSVFNLFDTLGVIAVYATNNIVAQENFELYVSAFKAVTCSGTEVQFNPSSDVVVVDPASLSSQEQPNHLLKIFPNPTMDFLFVRNLVAGNKKITILNSLGMNVKEFESSEKQLQIAVDDLPGGIYVLSIQSDRVISNAFFVVQH